eukprot:TRINITY_DN83351_c0_g1_i1.p1 TRINITY_DN83351_c0_g1~~TRINITY_DN83351_c0_g1_i1.p1  ORF type:complete len:492 (-),score=68.88 TRINITY_DN83351_c0_g1_i1:288-1763(-)
MLISQSLAKTMPPVAPEADKEGKDIPDGLTAEGKSVADGVSSMSMSFIGSKPIPLCFEGIDWSCAPKNGTEPVEVTLEPVVKHWEVRPIDGKERIFLKFRLFLHWVDYRFVRYPCSGEQLPDVWPSSDVPEGLWRPEFFSLFSFYFSSSLQVPQNLEKDIPPPTFSDPSRTSGKVQWELDFPEMEMDMLRGENANSLHSFPFDSGRYSFGLCMSGEKRCEDEKTVVLKMERTQNIDGKSYIVNWQAQPVSGEFYAAKFSCALAAHRSPNVKDLRYRDVIFSLHLARDPRFYIWKGMVPLIAIALFGFFSLFLEVTAVGERLALTCTLFLTCFAVQWLTLDRLPRVSYNTVFDHVVLSVGMAIFAVSLGSCASYSIGRRGRRDWENAVADLAVGVVTAADVRSRRAEHIEMLELSEQVDLVWGLASAAIFVGYIAWALGWKVKALRQRAGMNRKFAVGYAFFEKTDAWEITWQDLQEKGGLKNYRRIAASDF